MQADLVLVVDYGAQYAQLIARRVREAHVYSEIVPSSMPVAQMLAKRPKAIILSGGPASVYAEGAPQTDPTLFDHGVPVFGICYGFQAMVLALGGEVAQTGGSEFGRTAKENGTLGTDHGHANAMFVMGGPVQGGKVYGKWPGLAPEQLNEERDLALTTDFRDGLGEAVYSHLGNHSIASVFPNYDGGPARLRGFLRA